VFLDRRLGPIAGGEMRRSLAYKAAMTREEFEAIYTLRFEHEVEFGEIDMMRHVNNVCYAVWAERIRTVYFADVLGRDILSSEGIILAQHDMTFEATIAYREHILVGGRVARWGTKSFDFETGVLVPAREQRAFRSKALLVAFDYDANESIVIPADWRERVAAFERLQPA
jgi:acyl-CoA thioester hydrolase